MIRAYEAVYIFDAALEEDAVNEKLNKFHSLLPQPAGSAIEVSHWGKRTLAYPIANRETGYYVIALFDADGELLPEFERALKLDESVLRHLIVLNEGAQMAPTPAARDADSDGDGDTDEEEEED